MSKEIDCSGTDLIVCPYCGHEHEHEGGNPNGVHKCYSCEKNFECEADYSVSFTTWQVACLNGTPHEFRRDEFWHKNYSQEFKKEIWRCVACRKEEHRALYE